MFVYKLHKAYMKEHMTATWMNNSYLSYLFERFYITLLPVQCFILEQSVDIGTL